MSTIFFLAVFTIPMLFFVFVVVPFWIVMHYRSKGKTGQVLNQHEQQQLDALFSTIDQMSERIETLEHILDSKHQGWRSDPHA